MRMLKLCSLLAAAAFAGGLSCGFGDISYPLVADEEFTAALTGTAEVPPVTTAVTGDADFAVKDDSILIYNLFVADADSVTAAHIHEGAAGTPGPILVTLFTGASACKQNAGPALDIISSSVGNPTTIRVDTAHGRDSGSTFLVRIAGHTGSVPDLNGEHTARATGDSTFTVPVDVTTGGTGGTAQRFVLINTTSPRCRVDFTGPLAQTQIRYHALPSDTLTHKQYTGYGLTARERFDSLLVRMRNGTVYVNVHTRANPAGEVRGQLNPR